MSSEDIGEGERDREEKPDDSLLLYEVEVEESRTWSLLVSFRSRDLPRWGDLDREDLVIAILVPIVLLKLIKTSFAQFY